MATGCTGALGIPIIDGVVFDHSLSGGRGGSSPLPSLFNSGLLNFGGGEYSFVWNTATKITGLSGCQVSVVAQFDNGLVAAPAVFQYH